MGRGGGSGRVREWRLRARTRIDAERVEVGSSRTKPLCVVGGVEGRCCGTGACWVGRSRAMYGFPVVVGYSASICYSMQRLGILLWGMVMLRCVVN